MIAVPNEIPFLMFPPLARVSPLRSSKRNAYATAELTILRGLDRTPRLKLAVQGGSVEQGMDEVVAVVGPVWESDQVQGLDGVKCCELI